jgi:hypothetical protein
VVLNSGKDQAIILGVPRDISSINAVAGKTQIKPVSANRRQLTLPARQDLELVIEMK